MIKGTFEGRGFELRYNGDRFSGRYESTNAKVFIEEMEMRIYHPIKGIGHYKISDDELIGYLILQDLAEGTPLLKITSDMPALMPEVIDAETLEEDPEE